MKIRNENKRFKSQWGLVNKFLALAGFLLAMTVAYDKLKLLALSIYKFGLSVCLLVCIQ